MSPFATNKSWFYEPQANHENMFEKEVRRYLEGRQANEGRTILAPIEREYEYDPDVFQHRPARSSQRVGCRRSQFDVGIFQHPLHPDFDPPKAPATPPAMAFKIFKGLAISAVPTAAPPMITSSAG
jgi:hypothetical protein